MNTSPQVQSTILALENTNNAPSLSQRSVLLNHLSSLDTEIDALDREVQAIMKRRDVLVADRTRCARVLSLLRRLPDELFLEIFEYLCLEGKGRHRLAQVCDSWRRIILSTPYFWRRVHLTQKSDAARLACLEHHIIWSRGLPMSLTIQALPKTSFDALMEEIFSKVKAHWSSISLHARETVHLRQVMSYYAKFPEEAQYLSHMAFTAPRAGGRAIKIEQGILDFTPLSQLLSFRMDIQAFIASRQSFRINWVVLKHLHLRSRSSSKDYFQYVLAHCPNIESLFITPHDNSDEDLPLTTLKELKKLTIKATQHPSLFLKSLSAPFLVELDFDFCAPEYEVDMTALTFLERTGMKGPLGTFSCSGDLLGHILEAPHNRAAIDALSSISILNIHGPYSGQHALVLHDPEKDSDPPDNIYARLNTHIRKFPNLRLIEFNDYELFRYHQIIEMVQLLLWFSKLDGVRTIISNESRLHRQPSEYLREFQESGRLIVRSGLDV